MPLIGSRPRHRSVTFVLPRPLTPVHLAQGIAVAIRRAAVGRPSYLVATASANYGYGRYVLSDFLEAEEGARFVHRLRRLALEDADWATATPPPTCSHSHAMQGSASDGVELRPEPGCIRGFERLL
jgi:hypothetical protein